MTFRSLSLIAASAAGLMASQGSSARATYVLAPGGNVPALTADQYGSSTAVGATLVASGTFNINLIPGSSLAGVTVTEAVYKEAGGTTDFLYQINNTNGTGPVVSVD